VIPVMDRPLFTGLVEHSLDDKGRLVVPSRFRALLGSSFFLTILDPEGCLELCPTLELLDLRGKIEANPQRTAKLRSVRRRLFGNADEVSCDEQGRIMIPPALRALAGLQKQVVSIGSMSRVEVWAKENYERYLLDVGDLGDYTSELGLS
jgi:MraZ protein